MLPKKHRLSKHAEVATTTARGRSFFSPSFILKSISGPKQTTAKFTVITSVKVSKSAVVRNRVKRIIREVIHGHLEKIKFGQYVIIVKQAATKIPGNELSSEVKTALIKSKILSI